MSRVIALTVTLNLALSGCMGPGYVLMRPTMPSENVLLMAIEHRDPDLAHGNEQTASGALAGSTGGALTGAGVGAATRLSCGPWAVICVPTGLLVGATVGLVAGAVVGRVHSGVTSLPAEKAAALNTLLVERAFSRTYTASLHNRFLAQATGQLNVATAASPVAVLGGAPKAGPTEGPAVTTGNAVIKAEPLRIRVELAQLAFEQHSGDELTLIVSTSLQANYARGEMTKRYVFTQRGGRRGVDHWLADGGANLDAAIEAAFDTSTGQMVRLLLAPI